VKIIIGGETFDYDLDSRPLSEAIAIEKAWGRRYAEFQHELAAGSAEAWAVLAWAVWRRNGREVELQDILDGQVDYDHTEMVVSVNVAAAEEAQAAKDAAADPTSGAAPLTDPDGTGTTSAATSGRSRPSSGSARGKSAG
jgi:hypothetical protein